MPHSCPHPELLTGCVKGLQLKQHRLQFSQRQMANALGKCQFIVDRCGSPPDVLGKVMHSWTKEPGLCMM